MDNARLSFFSTKSVKGVKRILLVSVLIESMAILKRGQIQG